METLSPLIKHYAVALGVLLLMADLYFFTTTNPDRTGSSALFVGFLLVGATIFYGTWGAMRLLSRTGLKLGAHERKAGFGVAGIAALLLALQSVGQLGVRDIAVAVPFVLLAYLYLNYNQPAERVKTR